MSLRGRLLAASLALVAIGLVVTSFATYIAFRSFLLGQVDSQLRQDASTLVKNAGLRRGVVLGTVYFVELDPGGNTVGIPTNNTSATPELPANLPAASDYTNAQPFTVPSTLGGRPYYRVLSWQLEQVDGNYTAVLAVPLTEESKDLGRLIGAEVLVGAAVLLAAAVIGSWLVRLGLRPLGDIEVTADKIAEGSLTERIHIEHDHTEVGHLAGALNLMLNRLQIAFEERQRSEEALRASEERLRQFVSDASHELRTPIAAVRANAELFRRGGEAHPEDVPAAMARIEAEASRMGILVEDLLLLTRLDEGRPLEHAPVDLGALAADSVQAAKTIEPGRPIALTVEGSVEVLGDRHRLRQVIDNLLANVRTHTPAGTPAAVTVRQVGDRALIEVADSGPGIDPAVGAQIFERFFRADPSRARDRGGAGLGLSIVAAITAAHGGLASATNRLEGGALFRIDLPALVEAAQPEPIAELDAAELDADSLDGGLDASLDGGLDASLDGGLDGGPPEQPVGAQAEGPVPVPEVWCAPQTGGPPGAEGQGDGPAGSSPNGHAAPPGDPVGDHRQEAGHS
ncbi:MAG TPA: HAMP domain-containing sensor histidine kinase [Actinomycetota bacterium]|nr:HAMP domain-containing sensor histidine kinase [Actinomycetota bacterium]